MEQPKISSEFAISIVFIVTLFLSWIIWLTVRVEDLSDAILTKNYGQYEVPSDVKNPRAGGVACTQEAKLCPDGVTAVGRSGKSCEFALCPGESKSTTPTKVK